MAMDRPGGHLFRRYQDISNSDAGVYRVLLRKDPSRHPRKVGSGPRKAPNDPDRTEKPIAAPSLLTLVALTAHNLPDDRLCTSLDQTLLNADDLPGPSVIW